MISSQMLSSSRRSWRRGRSAAARRRPAASWWTGRRTSRRSTSRTGLMDSAYAAGNGQQQHQDGGEDARGQRVDQRRPRADAGLRRRTPGSPRSVSGAKKDGGLVAASASEWKEVSTIQSDREDEEDADGPGQRRRAAPRCRARLSWRTPAVVRGCSAGAVAGVRWCSSLALLLEQGRDGAQREGRDDDRADDHDHAGGGGQAVVVGVVERSGRSCRAGWRVPRPPEVMMKTASKVCTT